MATDKHEQAKAETARRRAEALRANLKRRKAARAPRAEASAGDGRHDDAPARGEDG